MQVDSYLELFTTLYGWAFANIIGAALVSTGLFALFLLIAFNAWRDAKESASAGASAVGLSGAIQVKLFVAIFVFVFAFCQTPFTTLANLSYTPTATAVNPNPNPTTATVGNTGTTYDQAMPQADSVGSSGSSDGSLTSVPMWWYLVMTISAGMDTSVRNGINSATVTDLRDIQALGRLAAIEDPRIKANVQRFYSECYIPARSVYMRMDKSTLSAAGQAIIDPSNQNYGPTDVDWMGSKLFQTESIFYPSMHSLSSVIGFLPAANEPVNANVAGGDTTGTTSQYGEPTCQQWWSDMESGYGLRAQIVNQAPPSSPIGQLFAAITQTFGGSATLDDQEDTVARAAIINDPPTWVDTTNTLGADQRDGLTRTMRNVGGGVGTLFTLTSEAGTMMATMHMTAALAMIQALILMAIYMLLPLIVLLSGYKLEVMFYGAMAIFTVKFWTVLWFTARWLDSNLLKAMYPDTGSMGSNMVGIVKQLWHGSLYKGPILDILLFAMYIVFPLIWSGMMGWIGIRVGDTLSNIMQQNAHPANAGNATGMHVPGSSKLKK
jgi:hypothetical protein